MEYYKDRWNNLTLYKNRVLKVFTTDKYRNHIYSHFLTGEEKMKNFDDSIQITIKNDKIALLPNGNEIKLHSDWQHMNSSQVMCINFFLNYWSHPQDLKPFLDNIQLESGNKIVGTPVNIIFEDEKSSTDGTNVDFVIKLEDGHKVFIEIKYTENGFGEASSKVKKKNPNYYLNKKNTIHKEVDIEQHNYEKYYQFVRNIYLGQDGNYSVFLFPKANKSIDNDYAKCSKEIIKNVDRYEFGKMYWENLVELLPNDDFRLKYFGTEEDCKE